jgi:glycosyltransferase involved in cell wall biosynthesis
MLRAEFHAMSSIVKASLQGIDRAWKAAYKKLPDGAKAALRQSWLWLRRTGFKLPYLVSRLRAAVGKKRPAEDAFDMLFVMDFNDEDWILGSICRRIAKESKGRIGYYHHRHFYSPSDRDPFWPLEPKLPDAKNYFFADTPFLAWCLKSDPQLWYRKTFVWDTHHPRERISDRELVYALTHATHTISTCSANRNNLISKGLRPERITTIIGGADPAVFIGHKRSPDGIIGFCAIYHPRKNPDRIIEIVERMPHRKFVLLGTKKWVEYPRFQHLKDLSNLEFVQTTYDRYPEYYRRMTVFVSVSLVEGGPIPVLEAMMSNVAPVASRTGFCEDLIRHGENGFLFDPYAPTDEVCQLIEKAFTLKADVRATVERYSWQGLVRQVNLKFA